MTYNAQVCHEAAKKAWITRKANAARKAAEAEAAKYCKLCGTDHDTNSIRQGNGWTTEEVPISGRYCKCCREGLDSGEYAAVGVAYEIAAMRNGRAWGCHPDMKPLLVQHRIECAGGKTVAVGADMPKISQPMTLESILKAHKKGNAKQPQKPSDETQAA